MRTIKRYSLQLNTEKWNIVSRVATAFRLEKDFWLKRFSTLSELSNLKSYYKIRNQLVQDGYVSSYGLQAREWKLALKDALETVVKNWQALFEKISPLIYKNSNLTDTQKHYCFWILKDYGRVKGLILREYPQPNFAISREEINKAGRYLNRIIRRYRGKNSRVRQARSFCLDEEMYTVFENNGTQYISIMTLEKYKRVNIPLRGHGKISGNIRIIVNCGEREIEVHSVALIHPKWKPLPSKEEALDFGMTEVFTDSEGNTYGEGFGKILKEYSDKLNEKGKARGKLHALAKKAVEKGQYKKAKNIKKFNLGFKKKDRFKRKAQTTIANNINRSFNQFFSIVSPAIFITENLRHSFSFDKSNKKFNRLVSIWVRGVIQDRAEFKALEGGSLHKQVNPAYGSQTCSQCGFVWEKNRKGDRFKCLFCGYEARSDRVAAMNYLARSQDQEISLYVPYKQVKEILVKKFLRRLECWGYDFPPSMVNFKSVSYLFKDWETLKRKAVERYSQWTVPGRTPETVITT